MKTVPFVIITLLSGAIAGILLGLINQIVVEPFIDKAISIETQLHISKGESVDITQQAKYRIWQKGGEVAAATIYGVSLSALFGIVFVYSRASLSGSNNKKKALFLASIMFFVLFLIPALKYPTNLPSVGDPSTIYYREILYVGVIAISGFTTLALAISYRKLKRRHVLPDKTVSMVIVPSIYAAIMIVTYLVFPPNPDKVTVPTNLVMGFRIASMFTIGVFWAVLGAIVGLLWDKFKLHETNMVSSADTFIGHK